jgi:hypothetical protein
MPDSRLIGALAQARATIGVAVSRFLLALWLLLSLPTAAFADDEDDTTSSGGPVPTLTPARAEAPICQVAGIAGRYLEIRGTGFDAWIDQRLPGRLTDADGNAEGSWRTIWVDPNGNVALAVNLCDDVAAGRGPLAPGTHWVFISDGSGGGPIASTSFDLSDQPVETPVVPLPQPQQPGTAPVVVVPPPDTSTTTPAPLPTFVAPGQSQPASAPTTGPGSRQQPLPIGSTITLYDGWQVTVTGTTPDAWSGIHAAVPSTVGPAPDLQYFIVRVQAIYTGTGSGFFNDLRLSVAGPNTTYDQIQNSCGLIPDEVPATLAAPGGVARGNVCFSVRKTDANSLSIYDALAPEASRTYVALH